MGGNISGFGGNRKVAPNEVLVGFGVCVLPFGGNSG